MTTPQHTEVAASLGELIALYVALGDELDRRDRSGISERVTGSKGESQPAPANLTVIEARRAIDLFAFQHAKMLIDAERMRTWRDTMPEAVCWVTTADGRQRIQREHVILASLAVRDAA